MRCISLISLMFLMLFAQAQLRLPSVISPGMVLQQNESVTLWGWANPGQKVFVTPSWNNTTDSVVTTNYATWKININTPAAGGPYTIHINTNNSTIELGDVLIGEVWVCSGQSNMQWSFWNGAKYIKEELPTSYNPKIRFFNIPRTASNSAQENVAAQWTYCDSVTLKSFSAVGYYFGKQLHHNLDVPIGLIHASWGGTPAEAWTPAEVVDSSEDLKSAASKLNQSRWWPAASGAAYNGMIYPITPFKIRGAIWYQGESNTGTNSTYQKLFTGMIGAWRKAWQTEFPFYYVQLAPFAYGNHSVGALLQEAQTKSMGYPKTGMVVITDLVDDVTDIHPSNKRDVGYRLANWALADTYAKTITGYRSPQYKSMTINKNRIELEFDYAPNGLTIRGKVAEGFFIAGDDQQWLPADVKLDKNKIIVWNKNLKSPTHVRFGFGNTLIGNIFSKEGLPLCPFRTDNFPVVQDPVN